MRAAMATVSGTELGEGMNILRNRGTEEWFESGAFRYHLGSSAGHGTGHPRLRDAYHGYTGNGVGFGSEDSGQTRGDGFGDGDRCETGSLDHGGGDGA